ncbi:hypothetical protein [Streptomyces sp. 900105755]
MTVHAKPVLERRTSCRTVAGLDAYRGWRTVEADDGRRRRTAQADDGRRRRKADGGRGRPTADGGGGRPMRTTDEGGGRRTVVPVRHPAVAGARCTTEEELPL